MNRRLFSIAALAAVLVASLALSACCGDCIKDPPCCQKAK